VADPVELVIFDCDGVLVDSERLSVRVESAYLTELGWPLGEAEVVERFMGRSDAFMWSAIEARLGPGLPAGWKDELARRYLAAFEADLAPVPGVVQALERITAAGTATCVASSGTPAKLRYTLGRTGLDRFFDGRVFSGTEVADGKPAPDLFLHAAARLGVDPAACAVVEDSAVGVQAARAAGMRALAYTGGLTPAERLAGPGTVLFADMRELPELVATPRS
jgi:HAD superfamily hydrolase (TIGR01509 family)